MKETAEADERLHPFVPADALWHAHISRPLPSRPLAGRVDRVSEANAQSAAPAGAPLVAPPGGREGRISTNPICLGCPTAGEPAGLGQEFLEQCARIEVEAQSRSSLM